MNKIVKRIKELPGIKSQIEDVSLSGEDYKRIELSIYRVGFFPACNYKHAQSNKEILNDLEKKSKQNFVSYLFGDIIGSYQKLIGMVRDEEDKEEIIKFLKYQIRELSIRDEQV